MRHLPAAAQRRTRALVVFSALLLLLAIKGDGTFPLPANLPEPLFQLYLGGLAIVFLAGFGWLLTAARPPSLDTHAADDQSHGVGAKDAVPAVPPRRHLPSEAAQGTLALVPLDAPDRPAEGLPPSRFPLASPRKRTVVRFQPTSRSTPISPTQPLPGLPAMRGEIPWRVAAAIGVSFCGLDFLLLLLESHRFAPFGYRLETWWALAACGLPALLLAALAAGVRPASPGRLLVIAAGGAAALELLAVVCFPLHPERSDMLPLLAAAGTRLLTGHNPYATYALHPGAQLPLTYLPGLLLAYLPAAACRCDPRLINVACTLASALLVGREERRVSLPAARDPETTATDTTAAIRPSSPAGPPSEGLGAACLSVFLLSPYAIYRHEIYLAPCLLVLLAVATLLRRGRIAAAGAAAGFLLILSQLFMPLVAALAVLLFGEAPGSPRATPRASSRALSRRPLSARLHSPTTRRGLDGSPGLRFIGLATAVALAGTLPFLLADSRAFLAGTLHHWSGVVNLRSLNLSYWLLRFLPLTALHLCQAAVAGAAFLLGTLRPRRLPGTGDAFALGALVLTLLAVLSPLVWTYFYLFALAVALPALWETPRSEAAFSPPPQGDVRS